MTSTGMKIGYARVSTTDQNLDLQEDALRAAKCEKIFTDRGSGSKTDRKGLNEALAYVRAGDTLVVWRLDRLGRSLKQLIDLVQELHTKGIHFTSLEESIDTSTPTGQFFFHVTGAFAELERNLIRERTQAGLKAARARGRVGGRPFLLNVQQREMLQKLMRDPEVKPMEVQKMFGIGKTALYRYAALDPLKQKGKDHVAQH